MKKTNKLLSILLATILILTLFPVTVANATDDVITFSAQADVTSAKAGDTVNVGICMSENSVVAALTLIVNYDDTALKLLDVQSNQAFGYEEFNTAFDGNKLAYLTISANPKTVSGTLFTIQFEVLKEGCTEVSLSVNEIADIDLNPLSSATQSAKIHHYETEITPPTCTEQGYTTYTCECGDTHNDNYVDANGHNFVNGTCTECSEKSVKWKFDEETGTLTIYGTGPMDDYNSYNRPWVELINDIKKVVVTNGVTKIGNDAFSGCKSLTNLIISDSVKIIGNNAFSGCTSLTNLTIPDSVTTIGGCAFNSCESIESVAIGSGVTTIGDGAFTWCDSLTYITVSDSNQCFSNDEYGVLFNKDKTTLIQYPIGNERNTYTIPDGVTTIYNDAFDESINLTSVIIPNSVTTIGYCAFSFCINLTSVTIPDSVTTIGKYAFSNCINLMDVTISNSLNTISEKSFYRCYKLTSIAIGDSVTAIDNWAFGYCTSLTNVTFPDSVMSIGDSAFYDCENLTNVTILNSLISIDNYAFYNCQSLIDVYYSGSKEEWNNILIGDNNYYLVNATIHYNYCEHKYIFVITLPTCTEQGFTTYTCTVCDDTYVDDETSATGHSYTSKITTPATHLTTGVMTFTCTCGDTYTEIIEKTTEHNYEAVITPPTCTEQGYTTYTCECGDTYIADYVNAKGHSYNSVVTEPTCTESGYTTHTCSVCGDNYVDSQTSATGHNYAEEITKPATHTENGVMTYTCHCGDSYTETINATGDHYYVPTVTPPTCTEGGYTTYTCACGDTYVDDETSAIGHDYDAVVTEPTCTETGYTTYTCTVCDDTYVDDETPANGHDYDAVVTEPTCTETGYTTYTCTVCDDTYVDDETPANGHSFSNGNCTVCGETDPDYYVFSVKTPSRTTIRNKDGIILHTEITGNAPAGSYVEWTSNNNNFGKTVMNDSKSLQVIANNKGNTTFTATLYDADGNALATESVELYSKSGFFDKIGGFFRSIFGSTKIHES